jgi:glycosyltransferase involved in cell wall biosynthesis
MKLAYITPGAAGMYCGSCLHDNTLASALIRQEHDVALVPIYTPIRTDEENVSMDRVFYGAINVFLEQKSALFRHTPWLVDRLLSTPRMLNWASGHGTSIDATELGDMTLSVLQGEEGKQAKELDRLCDWLADEYRPDLVHLSNSLLLGLVRKLKERLGVPVICSVQGEDIFLEELKEPYRTQVHDAIRERAQDADGFVSTSKYYVGYMTDYLALPPDRMNHVPLGVKLADFARIEPLKDGSPFVIGYLARICPEKGLHLLVQAVKHLVDAHGPQAVKLRVAGYLGQRDRAYLEGVMDQVKAWGLEQVVEIVGEVDLAGKLELLSSIHVLSVPTTYLDPKGRFILESLACGVPVVQPDHGAFPEMVQSTGGGLLVEPGDPQALATAFRQLMEQPERRRQLGAAGREVIQRDYSDDALARRTLEVYARYL